MEGVVGIGETLWIYEEIVRITLFGIWKVNKQLSK
jgi:hypothetical protein